MDELKISSKLMKGIISKLFEKIIRKKLGYIVYVDIDKLDIKVTDTIAYIGIDTCVEMDIDEFKKFTKILETRD